MSFSRILIRGAYLLDRSRRYTRVKTFFYDLLEDPRSPLRPYFDVSMMTLVILSVVYLIYEVKADLGPWAGRFESFAVTVFVVEYLLRVWVCSDTRKVVIQHDERARFLDVPLRIWPALGEALQAKWRFVTTPLAVIDLLAILPAYRPLRILRLFLLFRIFKLFRYARSIGEFVNVLLDKRFELYTLGIFVAFIIFVSSSVIYIFEADVKESEVNTFFDAVYWAAVTLSTVGYGDITPQTPEGRMVTMLLMFSGIAVISFSTSIIVSAFSEKLQEMSLDRVSAQLGKSDGYTIVCGYGRVGRAVVEYLARNRETLVVVDQDEAAVALAREQGHLAICGDVVNDQVLRKAGIEGSARRILCITGSDVANVYTTLTARHLNPGIAVISRASQKEVIPKFYRAGADHVVAPFQTIGWITARSVLHPLAFQATHGIFAGFREIDMVTLPLGDESVLHGRAVAEVDFEAHKLILFGIIRSQPREVPAGVRVYALHKSRFLFNPPPQMTFQGGDVMVLMGHQLRLTHFKQSLRDAAIKWSAS